MSLTGFVSYLDVIETLDEFILIEEDTAGESIESLLRRQFTINIPQFLELAIGISSVIGEFHLQGGIHRNLKPSNILIERETNKIKISGLGFISDFSHENDALYDRDVTRGTLPYLSPEQTGRMNRSVDYRTDLYSIGVILYEMLTGRPPFISKDPLTTIHSHLAIQPEPLQRLRPDTPIIISDIILKLLSKNNEDRYQNGIGLMTDLKECQKQYRNQHHIEEFEIAKYDFSHQFILPEKLFGRKEQVEKLLSAFDRLYTKRDLTTQAVGLTSSGVEVMLISGNPGVGKSALINEIHKPIVARRGYFLIGKYGQFEKDQPYSAIIQAFQGLVKQILSESDAQIQLWKEKLALTLGPNGKVITDIIPDIEFIIGKQPELVILGSEESRNRFKYVFEEFVSVLPSEKHPIALCLDDLQWADTPSLQLLKNISISPRVRFLYIIGSYRDNDAEAFSPIIELSKEIERAGVGIENIRLGPIQPADIAALIIDFLKCSEIRAIELANLIHHKTGGNPFFVKQFLDTLHSEKLITLNSELGWQWDIDGVTRLQVTDNMVEFLAKKIGNMSFTVAEILKTSAAIGHCFDLEKLSFVLGQPVDRILEGLEDSIKEGFVSFSPLKEQYIFNHDRIQEAAYSLVPEYERSALHYRIGRKAYEKALNEDDIENSLFYIVDQLNRGVNLISNPDEMEALARLNLRAGIKAKASAAYSPAFAYLQAGIDALPKDSWESQYNLSLSLYTEVTETAYLNGDFDKMEQLVETALQHTATVLDQVRIMSTRIYAFKSKADYEGSIDAALEILALLGIRLPKNPSKIQIGLELLGLKIKFIGTTPEQFIELPAATDPEFIACIKILVGMGVSALFSNPNLLALAIIRAIRQTFKKGLTPDHAFGTLAYGILSSAVLHDYENGIRFGKLGFALIEKDGTRFQLARTIFAYNVILYHWKFPLIDTIEPLLEGYRIGLETGDLDYAALCLHTSDLHRILTGTNLADIERTITANTQKIKGMNQHDIAILHSIMLQAIINLQGKNDNPHFLTGNVINAEALSSQWAHEKNSAALAIFYYSRLTVRAVLAEFRLALDDCQHYKQHKDSVKGAVLDKYANVFESICLLMLYPEMSLMEKLKARAQIVINQIVMKHWANNAPAHCMAMYLGVDAFCSWRLKGDIEDTKQKLDKTFTLCGHSDDILIRTLLLEYSTYFYESIGYRKSAEKNLQEAYSAFSDWGALVKLKTLREKYPEYLRHKIDKQRGD